MPDVPPPESGPPTGGDLPPQRPAPRTDPSAETSVIQPRPQAGTGSASTAFVRAPEPMPERIGGYRILHELGKGGMGLVYLAVAESDKLNTRVALKVVKRGMDTDEILKRFEQERLILSALNHPNIARFRDAGMTPDGRPYFVMEYIEGEPLHIYADNQRLDIPARLKLFRKVCTAVHYLHQNLIVHRDLKPHNILIGSDGEPKLLDLGIAKLLNPQMSPIAHATDPGIRLMTPDYASPEQVLGSRIISTTSDVYSLGVILYELLTGRAPYRFKTRIEKEIERIICEVDPERPSTRVTRPEEMLGRDGSSTTVAPEDFARVREAAPERLRKRLSGDLDDIVMLAMDKAPTRRYPSAEALSQDIERHLSGLPVQARRTRRRALYLATKFAMRNRGVVAATAAIIVALAGGGAAAMWGWNKAEQERATKAQNLTTSLSLATSMLRDLHRNIGPLEGSAKSLEVLASKTLDYLKALEAQAQGDPDVERALGEGYLKLGEILGGVRNPSLGRPSDALPYVEKAIAIASARRSAPGAAPDTATQLGVVHLTRGDLLRRLSRAPEAQADYKAALDAFGAVPINESNRKEATTRLAAAAQELGELQAELGSFTEAEQSLKKSVELRESIVDPATGTPADLRTLTVGYSNFADFLMTRGELPRAVEYRRKVLDIRKKLVQGVDATGRQQRDLAVASLQLGESLLTQGQAEEAAALLREALGINAKLIDADVEKKDTRLRLISVIAEQLLGRASAALDRPDDAAAALARAIEQGRALAATDPANTQFSSALADAHHALAEHELAQGRMAPALASAEKTIEIRSAILQRDPAQAQSARELIKGRALAARITTAMGQDDAAPAPARIQALRRARTELDASIKQFESLLSASESLAGDQELKSALGAELASVDQALAALNAPATP